LIRSIFNACLQTLPLPVFLIYAELIDKEISREWLGPYLLSSLTAISVYGYLLRNKLTLNRLMLGVNLYFFSGAVSLLIDFKWLNELYGQLEAAGMLLWILAVCLFDLLSPRGLFGHQAVPGKGLPVTHIAFVVLVLLTVPVSFYFQGNRLLAELLPFVVVFTAYGFLEGREQKSESL